MLSDAGYRPNGDRKVSACTHGCRSAAQGRLIDHLRNTQAVGLEDLQALVLDEADRLLEMGFAEEVRPRQRM